MNYQEKIKKLFLIKNELSVIEITNELHVSKQYVHRILIQLLDKNEIEKIGKPPKTIYRIKKIENIVENHDNEIISTNDKLFLEDNFLVISEIGKMIEGIDGFNYWCKKRKLPLRKTIDEFIVTKEKYNKYKDENGLISGLDKIKNTKGYDVIFLDEVYYLDFYAIERFGKTKLGTILHYAKQGQNKMLIDQIKPKMDFLVKELKIDAIGFVPPTIKRETQLIKELSNGLKINLPSIKIIKTGGIIPVPQKSLNKLEERINNAENTFVIKEQVSYNRILLIDDAVGSGSTLNQIAGKIKIKNIAKEVIGLAIVGSYKDFDVITDI